MADRNEAENVTEQVLESKLNAIEELLREVRDKLDSVDGRQHATEKWQVKVDQRLDNGSKAFEELRQELRERVHKSACESARREINTKIETARREILSKIEPELTKLKDAIYVHSESIKGKVDIKIVRAWAAGAGLAGAGLAGAIFKLFGG